jgi:lysozyme family protein
MTDAEILADIKRSEGWPMYTDHPADAGGPTKGGITLATFRTWRRDFTLTGADLRQLSEAEADAIYQFLYLQPFATVADPALRHYLIDLGVLRGPRKAAMMLQDIVGVDADGWIGPETLAAMTKYAAHLLVMLIGSRYTHIAQRVRENASQKVFERGWRNRNDRFLPE